MTTKEINIDDGREEAVGADHVVKVSPAESAGVIAEAR
jgi:hypothetical protein